MTGQKHLSENDHKNQDRTFKKMEDKQFKLSDNEKKKIAKMLIRNVIKERIKTHFVMGYREIWDLFVDIKNSKYRFWKNIDKINKANTENQSPYVLQYDNKFLKFDFDGLFLSVCVCAVRFGLFAPLFCRFSGAGLCFFFE